MAADLTELQRLAERATPSPWKAGHRTVTAPETDERLPLDVRLYGGNSDDHKRNAKYIAAMHPDTAKKLIAVVLAAQAWDRAWNALEATPVGAFTGKEVPACEAADEALRKALEELR